MTGTDAAWAAARAAARAAAVAAPVTVPEYDHCPECGSQDIYQDYIELHPVRTYGWVCDHCDHQWDVTLTPQDGESL